MQHFPTSSAQNAALASCIEILVYYCEIGEEAIWESRFTCFFIVTTSLKNSMYPRSFLSEEVKIEQHISSKKERREIGK